MKILIITGSPHKNGTSALLANEFIKGATEAGHTTERFDAAFANVRPCLGCGKCGMDSACVQKDDIPALLARLLAADMVVLATPLYYFGMSAQLKTVIDRFYSINGRIQAKHMDAILLSTCWDNDMPRMDVLKYHYETICDYLNWNNHGAIYGLGCGDVPMTKRTTYPEQAYKLVRSL